MRCKRLGRTFNLVLLDPAQYLLEHAASLRQVALHRTSELADPAPELERLLAEIGLPTLHRGGLLAAILDAPLGRFEGHLLLAARAAFALQGE
jgi:hypothetical protein